MEEYMGSLFFLWWMRWLTDVQNRSATAAPHFRIASWPSLLHSFEPSITALWQYLREHKYLQKRTPAKMHDVWVSPLDVGKTTPM